MPAKAIAYMAQETSLGHQFSIKVASQEEYDRTGGLVSIEEILLREKDKTAASVEEIQFLNVEKEKKIDDIIKMLRERELHLSEEDDQSSSMGTVKERENSSENERRTFPNGIMLTFGNSEMDLTPKKKPQNGTEKEGREQCVVQKDEKETRNVEEARKFVHVPNEWRRDTHLPRTDEVDNKVKRPDDEYMQLSGDAKKPKYTKVDLTGEYMQLSGEVKRPDDKLVCIEK